MLLTPLQFQVVTQEGAAGIQIITEDKSPRRQKDTKVLQSTATGNTGHHFNSCKTGCCRCLSLTAAILLMLCSTGCPLSYVSRHRKCNSVSECIRRKEPFKVQGFQKPVDTSTRWYIKLNYRL